MLKYCSVLVFLIFLLPFRGWSQYFSTGQDPAGQKWLQIKTKSYKIIYPADFGYKAQYLANVLDMAIPAETKTLHSKIPCIPFVLHTRSTYSNGVTVWAPKRIELYTCPPQDTYPEEWLEQLALHEYRHAVQISKMNQGFTKALYVIFGEQVTGGILGLFVPTWFLEGDATATETALSKTGRGRLPSFEAPLRAQILEKKIYSYDKATLGSYKTFIPDDYTLGYHLVAKGREKYGPGMWDYTLDRVAKYPFMVVPFASGIKRQTGLSKVKFYHGMLAELDSSWRNQEKYLQLTPGHWITHPDKKNYTEYEHPVHWNDSVILALKSDMNGVDHFVLIGLDGKEKNVFSVGNYQEESHSCANGKIVWSEYQPHSRWGNKSFSIIRVYDVIGKKVHDLTSGSRYFSPMISPDGKLISAVRVLEDNSCFLDLLDANCGQVLKSFPAPEHGLILTPTWSPDNSMLTYTLLTEKGKTIGILNPSTGHFFHYLPSSYNEISGPSFFYKKYLVYTADYTGIDNLFALDTLNRKIFQVVSARFASGDPDFSSDQQNMVYSDYCSDGLMIANINMDTTNWIPVEQVEDWSVRLDYILSEQEKTNIQDSALLKKLYQLPSYNKEHPIPDSIKATIYPTQKYRRGAHLFNLHSWAPVSIDVDNLALHPGISILSQNVMSTTFAGAGWEYDITEQTGKFYANLSYQGWYPVLDFRFEIGNRAGYVSYPGSSELSRFTWQETNLKAQVSIPWNFSHGKFSRSLTPSLGTTLIGIRHLSTTPSRFIEGLITSLDYRLYATQYLRSNQKDMFPKWGQTIELNYRHTPFSGNNMGSIFSAETNLYFPGIIRHQGLWCYAGYQQRNEGDTLNYSFSNLINYPRGYIGTYDDQLLSLSFNYKFPLFYPDFSAGSVFYFKRFKLNLFYDWAQGWDKKLITTYETCGAELTADLHILRFVYPFELGVRSMFFPLSSTWGWEFLYSVSF